MVNVRPLVALFVLLTLLGADAVEAQRPQSGYPTYVGKVSPSPWRHGRHRHSQEGFVTLAGFNLDFDLGYAYYYPLTDDVLASKKDLPLYGSIGLDYEVRFFQKVGLSVGVGAESLPQQFMVVEHVRLRYENGALCYFVDVGREVTGAAVEVSLGFNIFYGGTRVGWVSIPGNEEMFFYSAVTFTYPLNKL